MSELPEGLIVISREGHHLEDRGIGGRMGNWICFHHQVK
jgi:hypothetical protein